MLNVLFFIPTLGGGGAEKVLVNLVNAMDTTQFCITVQTIFDMGSNRERLNRNIRYIPGKLKKQFRGNTKLFKLFTPKFLFNFFVKEKYDVIISFLEGPSARIISGCHDVQVKKICWIHVEQLTMRRAAKAFRSCEEAKKCYATFDRIVCVSEEVRKDFKKLFDPVQECDVLYNVNDSDELQMLSRITPKNPVSIQHPAVISVGRLMEQKGYDRLLNAHSELLKKGYRHYLYILGEGQLRSSLLNQRKQLGVEDTVFFLGFQMNPYYYMKKCDLFVCSSRREGYSTVITESLIIGTPVVATNCSGVYEQLGKNNEYGIVVENSQEGIEQGLEMMLKDSTTLMSYQEKAQKRGNMFSKETTTTIVERYINSC